MIGNGPGNAALLSTRWWVIPMLVFIALYSLAIVFTILAPFFAPDLAAPYYQWVCDSGHQVVLNDQMLSPYPGKTVGTLEILCEDVEGHRQTVSTFWATLVLAFLIPLLPIGVICIVLAWWLRRRAPPVSARQSAQQWAWMAAVVKQTLESQGDSAKVPAADRLRALDDLKRQGLISESEYRAKREDILSGL